MKEYRTGADIFPHLLFLNKKFPSSINSPEILTIYHSIPNERCRKSSIDTCAI